MSEEAKMYTCSWPAHAYNVASETCRACNGICGGKLCQIKALHSICHRIQSLLAGDDE